MPPLDILDVDDVACLGDCELLLCRRRLDGALGGEYLVQLFQLEAYQKSV